MMKTESVLRIHPAIGIARVGNSPQYYLGPETMAGLPLTDGGAAVGGLPIRPGTESETITSSELRDRYGALKRQGARFRIYAYSEEAARRYPSGEGTEIKIGSEVDGHRVVDIVWTVHLANKKAAWYYLSDDLGMEAYDSANASTLALRNPSEGNDPNNAARLRKLVIDPGPRAICGTDQGRVRFDKATFACYGGAAGAIREVPGYPKSFPDDAFSGMYTPTGKIETLGELETDEQGRLIVLGGHGISCGWLQPNGEPYPLEGVQIADGVFGDVNANGWFDDTSDGPVSAVLVLDDGSVRKVSGAWVVSTLPSYAPQTLNVVSVWDDVFDTWVRKIRLLPEVFRSRFQSSYKPYFEEDIYPIFRAAALQRWNTNLPKRAIAAHDAVGRIKGTDNPGDTILTGLAFIRNPNEEAQYNLGAPFMPLSMGDAGKAFLSVTRTQYFFLKQWNDGNFIAEPAPALGPGEFLDKAVLVNCLGGRFAPGMEMTFIVRDPAVYKVDWRATGVGPFRIRKRALDYSQAQPTVPFLTAGYTPQHAGPDGILPAPLEPGDATKFMAIPWQTDYSACATHNTAPNPTSSSTLYWSWPAQRPVAVHVASEVHDGKLGPQRYSVRGVGTYSEDYEAQGRFQDLIDSVLNWHKIGFIIQGSAIDSGGQYSPSQFLEVLSMLDEPEVPPWPFNATVLGT